MVRGEVFRLPPPKSARGHEQRGARFAVVVQADEFLGLSTLGSALSLVDGGCVDHAAGANVSSYSIGVSLPSARCRRWRL